MRLSCRFMLMLQFVKEHSMSEPNQEDKSPVSPIAKNEMNRPRPLLLTAALAAYTACILIILTANYFGPENWWMTGLNLYLPQWIWAVPLAFLIPWVLLRAPKRWWLMAILSLLVLGPIMGGSLNFFKSAPPQNQGMRLRVMTYNIKWAKRNLQAVLSDITTNKPDLMLMQDSGNGLNPEFRQFLTGWNVQAVDQYIIASRLPLTDMDVRWISNPDHSHRVERCILHANGQEIVVYSCHLASPRYGLAAMKHPRKGMGMLIENMETRVRQSRQLAEILKTERLPMIVTGDFNAPVQSIACRNLFSLGLTDAFSAAGAGYGYTYGETTKVGHSYVRIDHIFTSPQWQVLASWAGDSAGSDHCPVFADIYLPERTNLH